MIIPFAVHSYQSASLPVSSQRCLNLYAEAQPQNAKTPVAVFGVPGLTEFAECDNNGPLRGFTILNEVLYAVSGNQLFRISVAGVATLVGTGIDAGMLSIDNNGTQICIVTGELGYIYTVAGGLVQITDADFNAARTVTFFDSYFVFDRKGTSQFFSSAPLDGLSYDALDFGSAEARPDNVVGVKARQDNVLVFGERSIETIYNDPSQDFPLVPIAGGTVERGCAAPHTIVREDNSIFFLGNDRIFYRMDGIIPSRKSTHALETAWAAYGDVSEAHCFSTSYGGHKVLHLTFPEQDMTFAFDISTSLWHERASYNSTYVSYGRWRGNCAIECYGYTLVGDFLSGKIGRLNNDVYTEFGDPILAEAISPSVHMDRKRVFFSRFELDIETGVGLTVGQGVDPQVMLNWSDDGGRTWSAQQIWQSAGAIGAYRQRLRWMRLGNSRDRMFKVTMSDPVKRVIMAAHADVTAGL